MSNNQNYLRSFLNDENEISTQIKDSRITTTATTEQINIQPVRSMTCYICLENIVTTHREFGIQNNCDHIFCFNCLSTWRRTNVTIDKDTGRRCPLCRTRSTFIARSWRCFNNAEDKQHLIDTHKLYLKTIPCRILLRYGYCRFGRRCYYNHHIFSPSQMRFSSSIDTSISPTEYQANPLHIFQSNVIQTLNENNHNEQQQQQQQQQPPPRRFSYNAHRYRPY